MRLIDADAIKEDFEDTEQRVVALFGEKSMEACLIREAINKIDSAPTIDPVKHGHWVVNKDTYTIKCSECGYERYVSFMQYIPEKQYKPWEIYCPICGAKLDKEVSE